MIKFTGFSGANLALHPLNLPPNVGVASLNQRPGRGDLRPWAGQTQVATVAASMSTIYRMGRDVPNDATYWLAWSGDVDVVRTMIASDTSERTIWTDGVAPKWTDNTIGLSASPYPSVYRLLGIPAPSVAPSVALVASGSATAEAFFHVVTLVNARGEESAPSPVSASLTAPPDSQLTVTRNGTVPSNRDVSTWRLYRTVTATSGQTDFYFVAEAPIAQAAITYSGVNPVDILPSTDWSEPPADMKGITAMWNGMMAGFTGKSVRFCEPYRPFAWPIQYELSVDDTIVGLGVFGQSLLVLTTGRPHLMQGSDPASMNQQPLEFEQACVSKRSIVGLGHGVAWASPDGLAYYGQGGGRLLTSGSMLRDDWLALTPTTITGVEYEGMYVASYGPSQTRLGFIVDPADPRIVMFLSFGWTHAFRDTVTDSLYLLVGTAVKKWGAGSALTAEWESKTELAPAPVNYPWCRVIADSYPVTITIKCDGVTRVASKQVQNGNPFRLPGGFRADKWAVRVLTTVPVQAVLIGDSQQDLMRG